MPESCVLRVPASCIEEYRADVIWSAAFHDIQPIGEDKDNTVATFEDLTLAPESYWAGDDEGEEWYFGLGYTQRFKSGGYSFVNNCIPDYQTWCGYAYSNQTSTEFLSLSDQFISCVGSGNNGSANYCVAYPDGTMWGEDLTIEVVGDARVVPGFYITNSAYTLSSITKGDSFAGDPFTAGDYFKVTIHSLDADGEVIASRDFCLADYRFENEADRYYVNSWQYVDLSKLGEASAFKFTFSGSRSNSYGLTTPTYFCIDDFGAEGEEVVREEGTFDGKASSVSLDAEEITLTIGESVQLTATVTPEAAVDKTVTWVSSDDTIATVDTNGVITAVAAGETTITATCDNISASCIVNVNKKTQTIEWDQDLSDAYDVGAEITLTASSSAGLEITYQLTAGSEYATLTGNILTIVANGRIEITATQDGNDEYEAAEPVVKIFDITTGIESIMINSKYTIYNIDGVRTDRTVHGVNIIRHADGTVSKVYVK